MTKAALGALKSVPDRFLCDSDSAEVKIVGSGLSRATKVDLLKTLLSEFQI